VTTVRRRVTILLLVGGVVGCWGAAAMVLGSSNAAPDDPASSSDLPTARRAVRPLIADPTAATTTLPVPAALADGWLSMRAGPVPVPIELHMPTLGVHAQVLGVGVTARGEMDAPQGRAGDPVWERAFWYRGSAVPGATSTALIAGHASAPNGGTAVFQAIERLHPGDPISVHDTRTGLDVDFAVTELAIYTVDQASSPAVLTRIYGAGPASGEWSQPSTDGLAHLTLITCAGSYRSADGTHDHRLVVYAQRVS
jgi:hypothetical protein